MSKTFTEIKLRDWQLDFVNRYLSDRKSRSLLVAKVGTGKTITAMYTASKMIENNYSDSLLIISDTAALKEQWKYVGGSAKIEFIDKINETIDFRNKGVGITIQSLRGKEEPNLIKAVTNNNFFIVIDEAHRHSNNKQLNNFLSKALEVNEENKILLISQTAEIGNTIFDKEYRFDTQYIFQDSIIKLPEIRIEIAHFSPSFSILEKLLKQKIKIDDLNWRDFEKLISQLLEKDGYEVELMRGTRDGGVDVIANKKLGAAGSFRTLWQAKKKLLKNKVGLSVIRELADTTKEFKASKGLIVTTTYLTKDALARVQRDNYILGKVDRDDLNKWINNYFL